MEIDEHELEALLALNEKRYYFDDGFWVKIEARKVDASEQVPHGIVYCLTLHDKANRRVFGIDNAHGNPKAKKGGRYSARIIAWDHKHHREKVEPYEFESPGQLLEDFWDGVNQITPWK
jgi:hypothetical protein